MVPEFLEHDGSAVEIDLKDSLWRGLAGRHAGGVNETGDVAEVRRLANEGTHGFTRGQVDGRDGDVVTGIAQDLGYRVRVGFAAISKHDVLSDAHAPNDRLTDLSGANQDDDVAHDA